MTQNQMVLEHLREHNTITSMEAYTLYGITRLAARIANLKQLGYKIASERKSGKNRFGNMVTFAEYILERGDE